MVIQTREFVDHRLAAEAAIAAAFHAAERYPRFIRHGWTAFSSARPAAAALVAVSPVTGSIRSLGRLWTKRCDIGPMPVAIESGISAA